MIRHEIVKNILAKVNEREKKTANLAGYKKHRNIFMFYDVFPLHFAFQSLLFD
jgi:hypothetical protein